MKIKNPSRKMVTFFSLILILYSVLGLTLETSNLVSDYNLEKPRIGLILANYTAHDQIQIHNDSAFQIYGFQGNGTQSNPYLIEGLNINTGEICISIANTSVWFIIRNCILSKPGSGTGVKFQNVTKGQIDNCTILTTDIGIRFEFTESCSITGCLIYETNWQPVYFFNSTLCLIQYNTIVAGFGRLGVTLDHSQSISIIGNNISGCGITIYGDSQEWQHTIQTNFVNNRLLGYFFQYNNDVINGDDYGQLFLVNCTNVQVIHGNFNYSSSGVAIVFSRNCTLSDAFIVGCRDYGLRVFSSPYAYIKSCKLLGNNDAFDIRDSPFSSFVNNTIISTERGSSGIELRNCIESTITDNLVGIDERPLWGTGIYLSKSDGSVIQRNIVFGGSTGGVKLEKTSYCKIIENVIYYNSGVGIYLDWYSNYNSIYYNALCINFPTNAQDNGMGNQWDDGESRGNSWDDYWGVGTYSIPGVAEAIDHYPWRLTPVIPPATPGPYNMSPGRPYAVYYGEISIGFGSIMAFILGRKIRPKWGERYEKTAVLCVGAISVFFEIHFEGSVFVDLALVGLVAYSLHLSGLMLSKKSMYYDTVAAAAAMLIFGIIALLRPFMAPFTMIFPAFGLVWLFSVLLSSIVYCTIGSWFIVSLYSWYKRKTEDQIIDSFIYLMYKKHYRAPTAILKRQIEIERQSSSFKISLYATMAIIPLLGTLVGFFGQLLDMVDLVGGFLTGFIFAMDLIQRILRKDIDSPLEEEEIFSSYDARISHIIFIDLISLAVCVLSLSYAMPLLLLPGGFWSVAMLWVITYILLTAAVLTHMVYARRVTPRNKVIGRGSSIMLLPLGLCVLYLLSWSNYYFTPSMIFDLIIWLFLITIASAQLTRKTSTPKWQFSLRAPFIFAITAPYLFLVLIKWVPIEIKAQYSFYIGFFVVLAVFLFVPISLQTDVSFPFNLAILWFEIIAIILIVVLESVISGINVAPGNFSFIIGLLILLIVVVSYEMSWSRFRKRYLSEPTMRSVLFIIASRPSSRVELQNDTREPESHIRYVIRRILRDGIGKATWEGRVPRYSIKSSYHRKRIESEARKWKRETDKGIPIAHNESPDIG